MRWIPVIIILLLAGCGSKNKVPSDVLPPAKMQAVMWDILRADQFLGSYVFIKDSSLNKQNESLRMYDRVLDLHQTNMEEFRRSFAYYQAHPQLMKVIMDSLSQLPKAVTKEPGAITQPVSVEDSLKKEVPLPDTVKTDTTKKRPRVRIQKVLNVE